MNLEKPNWTQRLSGMVPTFSGSVLISRVKPKYLPAFDETIDVSPYSVEPLEDLPSFNHRAEVNVSEVQLPESRFDTADRSSDPKSLRQVGVTMPRPNDAPGNSKEATLGSWEAATFPTWTFWGRTTVHVYNVGDGPITVSVQAGAAQPAYFYLDAGEDHREYGFWGGFPVTVTNATQRDSANGVTPAAHAWVW